MQVFVAWLTACVQVPAPHQHLCYLTPMGTEVFCLVALGLLQSIAAGLQSDSIKHIVCA